MLWYKGSLRTSVFKKTDLHMMARLGGRGAKPALKAVAPKLHRALKKSHDSTSQLFAEEVVVLYTDNDEDTKPLYTILRHEGAMSYYSWEHDGMQYKSWCLVPTQFNQTADECAAQLMDWLFETIGWQATLQDFRTANVHGAGPA